MNQMSKMHFNGQYWAEVETESSNHMIFRPNAMPQKKEWTFEHLLYISRRETRKETTPFDKLTKYISIYQLITYNNKLKWNINYYY